GMLFSGGARYLAFLDIPSFGIAAFLAVRYVDDLRDSQRARGKGERNSSREKKIQEAFEAQARVIKAAVSALQVESPVQILEVLGRKAQLEVKVTELRDQLAAREQTPEYRTTLSEEGKLKREQKELNDQLTEKGAYIRDPREVEREVERLRQSIARARAQPQQAAPAVVAPPSPPVGGSAAPEDPFPALLSLGADLFGVDVAGAGAMIRDRWVQYFAALTNQRYQGIELDKECKAHVFSGGQKTPAVAIPGKDLDLLYFAARLTLIEKHSARQRVPCLFEDVFTELDDAKLFLLGRMLKQLSAMTQVLHVAGQPGFSQLADGTVAM
ncbi:MAG TPA: chromosome segregation protein SMC, partial [Myxococcales bacterium]